MAGSNLREVLTEAWTEGFTTKSNFARKHAYEVAEAASRGLITILSPDGRAWSKWLITPEGCVELWNV